MLARNFNAGVVMGEALAKQTLLLTAGVARFFQRHFFARPLLVVFGHLSHSLLKVSETSITRRAVGR